MLAELGRAILRLACGWCCARCSFDGAKSAGLLGVSDAVALRRMNGCVVDVCVLPCRFFGKCPAIEVPAGRPMDRCIADTHPLNGGMPPTLFALLMFRVGERHYHG